MTALQDAMLARMNKQAMVDAFHAEGFTEINMGTSLETMADYVRWCGGLRDLTLACVRKADGANVFFTEDEWNAMSANTKSRYVKIGVRIRARKRCFILAKDNVKDADGGLTFAFGCYGTDLKGVQNYGSNSTGLYGITSGQADTKAAIDQSAGKTDSQNISGAPACEAAWNYKAADEDRNQWYLPSIAELRLVAEYRVEINAFLTRMFTSENLLLLEWYWSSTEVSSAFSWYVSLGSGGSDTSYRTNRGRVRPVCVCASAE